MVGSEFFLVFLPAGLNSLATAITLILTFASDNQTGGGIALRVLGCLAMIATVVTAVLGVLWTNDNLMLSGFFGNFFSLLFFFIAFIIDAIQSGDTTTSGIEALAAFDFFLVLGSLAFALTILYYYPNLAGTSILTDMRSKLGGGEPAQPQRKLEIGAPTNFQHLQHISTDKASSTTTIDPTVKGRPRSMREAPALPDYAEATDAPGVRANSKPLPEA